MTPEHWHALLEEVTQIGGVRGAAVISAEDGLVVYESAMEGVATADVAALAAALVRRALSLLESLGDEALRMVTLAASRGTLVAVQGRHELWLVAVAEPGAELGRLRLLLGDLAPELE
jgi:predicted regulator of Ras-like GTPase activity (Roadblock/LC7/MglB family)